MRKRQETPKQSQTSKADLLFIRADNIAILWRNEHEPTRALPWFKRAVKMGDAEANLEIAKYLLAAEDGLPKAIAHLERVCRSKSVTEAGAEEAARLLKQARKKLNLS